MSVFGKSIMLLVLFSLLAPIINIIFFPGIINGFMNSDSFSFFLNQGLIITLLFVITQIILYLITVELIFALGIACDIKYGEVVNVRDTKHMAMGVSFFYFLFLLVLPALYITIFNNLLLTLKILLIVITIIIAITTMILLFRLAYKKWLKYNEKLAEYIRRKS